MKSLKKRISLLLMLVLVAVGACALFLNGNEAQAADVDAGMLEVKMQISNASVTDGNVTAHRAIRFISSVDSLDYSEVGFIVNGKSYAIRTVYEKIDSTLYEGGDKLEYTFSPKIVDATSEYFFTAKMAVSEEKMNDDFTVQAYCKTFGGQVVVGEERVVSVAKDTSNTAINLTVAGELDKNTTYTAAFTSKVNSTVTSVTETAATVEVLSVGDGYSNVRITLTGSNKVSDMASATKITINGTEAAGVFRNYYTSYLSGTNAGKPDTSWYDVNATGTEFVLATNADLYGFATINENFAGDSVYLVSDIKANDGTAKADGFTGTTTYEWAPIGWAATDRGETVRNFAGTFDGQNHTISGVYLAKTGTANGSWGLFGETNACTIKNFTLANSYFGFNSITNTLNIGTVAGRSKGIIDTIKVADTVYVNAYGSQTEYIGGIVGYMSGTAENYGKITNCWFDGTITGHDYIGGIVSIIQDGTETTAPTLHKKEVEISHCLNSGTISVNKKEPILGGVCSYITFGQAIIEDCVNVSNIVTNDYALHSILTGSVVGWVTANPYKDSTTTVVTNKRYSLVMNNTYGTSDGNWKCTLFSNGSGHHCIDGAESLGSKTQRIPSFTTLASYKGETGYLNMNLDFTIGNDYDGYWTATADTPVLSSFVGEATVFDVQKVSTPRTIWYAAAANEYKLYTKADLFGFASLTDVTFEGKTVKLGADITMNQGVASETGFAAATGTTLVEWTPRSMAGTFDGNNHTLKGVYVDAVKGDGSIGLFSTVSGTVKNLKLQNSYFNHTDASTGKDVWSRTYTASAGSIAGNLSGTLDTVYSDAIVKHAGAYVGGLVGVINSTTGRKTITNCCYTGSVTGSGAVGGILGLLVDTTATVTHCMNAGKVTGDYYIGGLCGEFSARGANVVADLTLTDCLNVGRAVIRVAAQPWNGTVGYMTSTATATSATVDVTDTYSIGYYADGTNVWNKTLFIGSATCYIKHGETTYTKATNTTCTNTSWLILNYLPEDIVIEKSALHLSFLPEGQESSSTDAYYWVARDGKIPMLESFEDLLTNVTY